MGSVKPAHLYVIANGAGAHKVGLSMHPRRRLRELQAKSAQPLSLVRVTDAPSPQAGQIEAYAHWLLREAQETGEWFSVTAEAAWVAIVAATEAVARGEMAPERVAGPGRPMLWPDKILAALPPGSLARMERVLADGEDKTDLLREAVERELQRRGSMPEDEPPAPAPTPKTKPKANPPSHDKGEG